MDKDQYVAFGTFSDANTSQGKSSLSLMVASKLEDIKEHLDEKALLGSSEKPSSNDPTDILTNVGFGIWHFYNQLKKYYELVSIVDMVSTTLITSFFKNRIIKYVEKNLPVTEEYNKTPIYGIGAAHIGEINKSIEHWGDMQEGLEQL